MKVRMMMAVSLVLMECVLYALGMAPGFMIMFGVLGVATIAAIFFFSNGRASDSTDDQPNSQRPSATE